MGRGEARDEETREEREGGERAGGRGEARRGCGERAKELLARSAGTARREAGDRKDWEGARATGRGGTGGGLPELLLLRLLARSSEISACASPWDCL